MLMPARMQQRRPFLRPGAFIRKNLGKTGKTDNRLCRESFAAVAHDARNAVAALQLYCDLLAEPGVLTEDHRHFAQELQVIACTSSGLVERLAMLRGGRQPGIRALYPIHLPEPYVSSSRIDDLAAAVKRLKGPLAALAGRKVALEMECLPCHGRIQLSYEGLTRILINLTRNAAEAMPHGGRIRITVQQGGGGSFFDFLDGDASTLPHTVLLCVQDSGPGIAEDKIKSLFGAGFTAKKKHAAKRGLGLPIVRQLVEIAGGCVRAVSTPGQGARFEVELPLIGHTEADHGFVADFSERANIEC